MHFKDCFQGQKTNFSASWTFGLTKIKKNTFLTAVRAERHLNHRKLRYILEWKIFDNFSNYSRPGTLKTVIIVIILNLQLKQNFPSQ